MPDAIWRINKSSQNIFAEAFCKIPRPAVPRGPRRRRARLLEDRRRRVHAFLNKHNIDTRQIVVADGSGLSRENRVTSRADQRPARHDVQAPVQQTFRDSLADAGVDGTIGKRMKDLKGRVFAKTGYIGGVRSLSGYVKTKDGKWLVFSIIYNGIHGSVKPYEALQDDVMRLLVDWPNQKPRAPQPEVEEPTTRPAQMRPQPNPRRPASSPSRQCLSYAAWPRRPCSSEIFGSSRFVIMPQRRE